jgi:hypothetical protein
MPCNIRAMIPIRNLPLLTLSVLLNTLAAGLLPSLFAFASATAREARWVDQIVDDLIHGEPVWLDAQAQA